jgi:hypothetical protein
VTAASRQPSAFSSDAAAAAAASRLAGLDEVAPGLAIRLPLGLVDQVVLRQQVAHRLGGLGADADPVLDAVFLQFELAGLVLGHRVVPAEILDHATIAPGALVDRVDAVEGPVTAAKSLHANANHGQSPRGSSGDPRRAGRQV